MTALFWLPKLCGNLFALVFVGIIMLFLVIVASMVKHLTPTT